MKRIYIIAGVVLMAMLALALCVQAVAETYPIYEVIVRPALLRKTPALSTVSPTEDPLVICTVPINSKVLVAAEKDGWCLVYTQEKLTGYMQKDDLKPTGTTYDTDFAITADKISGNRADIQYISIDPQAMLPDKSEVLREYPTTLSRGDLDYDLESLLNALLGEGYEKIPRDEYAYQDEYQSRDESKPYRYVYIDDETSAIHYYDAMVTGERSGEYQPPHMNMLPDESLSLCRSLLTGIVDPAWLEHPSTARRILERWSYLDRWMTDSEYVELMRDMNRHYFTFEHRTADGICILDDDVTAAVGVNGLDTLVVNRHEFTVDDGTYAAPISLDDAVALANTTRSSPTVLLYAQLVYSNRVTQSDEFNLSWYLVTSEGNYVVDCVLRKHVCDSYEY